MVLEPQLESHAEEMFLVLSDPAIYEFENEPPKSLDWLRERYEFLERRSSPDGLEQWLNWVIRLSEGNLIGYVQATVLPGGTASIGYELTSAYWGKGLARQAVEGMIQELGQTYEVSVITAAFKSKNFRSRRLLERLGFNPATEDQITRAEIEEDEELMVLSKLGT
jgi:RimJ/RimL family protein N-acetyltransferase